MTVKMSERDRPENALSFEKQRLYFNLCKVEDPLDPDDPRNLDIDRERGNVRGLRWVDRLADQVQLSNEPTCLLFTGLPGSGKSTELRRLARKLENPGQAHLLSVIVDAEQVLDLFAPVDVADVLAAVVDGMERAVLVAEKRDPEKALQDGYLTRLWNWLSLTDVELGKGEYQIPGGPKLVGELKTRPSLRARLRQTISQHLSQFLAEVHAEVAELEARARKCGYKGLFVVLDSLEKLRGSGESFHQVLESAVRLFAHDAEHLRLPVSVLYTVPPALYTRLKHILVMPVVKLREKDDDTPDPDGTAVLRELVRRRIPDHDLHLILGQRCEERLTELFELSGGYPRELVKLLRDMLSAPEFPIGDRYFEVMLNEMRAGYRMVTPASAFEWLARVDREHFLTTQDDAHRRAADEMLSLNCVLLYYNGQPWWGLHPAVRAIPGVQKAIHALKES